MENRRKEEYSLIVKVSAPKANAIKWLIDKLRQTIGYQNVVTSSVLKNKFGEGFIAFLNIYTPLYQEEEADSYV